MEKAFVKYCMGTYAYSLARNVVYAPPMKKDDYVTDRVGKVVGFALIAPWSFPVCVYTDLKNIEHRARKMPGPIDRYPW
jgi:hypothetical protein